MMPEEEKSIEMQPIFHYISCDWGILEHMIPFLFQKLFIP